MGFKKTLLKNVAVFGSYNYVFFFIEFLSTVILSRLLLPEEYGFVAIILVFSGFIQLFANAGLSQAVIRTDYRHKFFKLIFNLTLWIGILLTLILVLLAYPISLFYDNPKLFLPTIVVSLTFVGTTVTIVPMAILLKELKFNQLGKLKLISAVVSIILMIVMAYFGCSYWSLIIPNVVRVFLFYILIEIKIKFGFYFYGWKLTKFALKLVKDLLQTFTAFNMINYWASNLDTFLIGKFFGNYDLGIYNRAYRFLQLGIKLINTVFGNVLLPSLKKEVETKKDYRQGLLDILDVIHILGLLFSVALVIFPAFIVRFLWGENWLLVADYMPYFGAIIPLQTLVIACDDLYILERKEKALLSVGIPTSIILIVGIVLGSMFSALYVARMYAIFMVAIQIPYHLVFGHYKVLKFPKIMILKFWMPKIIFSFLVIASIWFSDHIVTYILYGVYFLYLVISHMKNFKVVFAMICNKINKKSNS